MTDDPPPPATPAGPPPPATPPDPPAAPRPWSPAGWYRGFADPDADGRPRFDWTAPPRGFPAAAARDWLARAVAYLELLLSERAGHVLDGNPRRRASHNALLLEEDYRNRHGPLPPLPAGQVLDYEPDDMVIELYDLRVYLAWFTDIEWATRETAPPGWVGVAAVSPWELPVELISPPLHPAAVAAAVTPVRELEVGESAPVESYAEFLAPIASASPAAVEPRPRPFRVDRSDPDDPRVVRTTDPRAEKVTDDAAVFLEMVLEADGSPVPSGEVAKRLGIEEFKVTRVMKQLPKWVRDHLAPKTGSGTSLLREPKPAKSGPETGHST